MVLFKYPNIAQSVNQFVSITFFLDHQPNAKTPARQYNSFFLESNYFENLNQICVCRQMVKMLKRWFYLTVKVNSAVVFWENTGNFVGSNFLNYFIKYRHSILPCLLFSLLPRYSVINTGKIVVTQTGNFICFSLWEYCSWYYNV